MVRLEPPDFPQNLQGLKNRPRVLYALGGGELLKNRKAAAVIGTLDPSPEGIAACRELTLALVERGFVIVSGLAAGCDSAAHRACLEAGGSAVAVLAHGLDYCYPASNRGLREAILEQGGLLLSEYPPGTAPRRHYFVARDRIQSGLSLGVVLIQSDVTGGSMHTVGFAEKQGRPVGVIPGLGRGNRMLLEEKRAHPLGSPGEIGAFIRLMTERETGGASPLQGELF
ncbi:MAG: DNA-protecting protein DprA [Treponema sp.]|jgi:DNA processing protein|nr:DNA-protecting protein DprA [Treponema sp.]